MQGAQVRDGASSSRQPFVWRTHSPIQGFSTFANGIPVLPAWIFVVGSLFLASCQRSVAPPIPTLDLVLWLRADKGVELNDSLVCMWADQSGNGNHALQAEVARQPVLVRGELNGYPVVRFDGVNDRLGFTGSQRMSQLSVFMVFMIRPGSSQYDPIALGESDLDGKIWVMDLQSTYTEYAPDRINIVNGAHGKVAAVSAQSAVFEQWHNLNAVTDRTICSTAVRVDGVDARVSCDNVNMTMDVSLGSPGGLGHGGIGGPDEVRHPIYRRAARCDIAEVIVYAAALSDSSRLAVERYLGAKYRIPPSPEAGIPVRSPS